MCEHFPKRPASQMKNVEEEKKNKKRNERTNKTDSSIGPAVQSHSLVNLFFFPFFLSLQSFYIKPSAFTCVINHYIPLSPSMCLIYLKPDCCSPLMSLFSFHPIYGPPFSFFFFLFLKFPQEGEEGKGKKKLVVLLSVGSSQRARHHPLLHLAGTRPSGGTPVATRLAGSTVHLTSSSVPVAVLTGQKKEKKRHQSHLIPHTSSSAVFRSRTQTQTIRHG